MDVQIRKAILALGLSLTLKFKHSIGEDLIMSFQSLNPLVLRTGSMLEVLITWRMQLSKDEHHRPLFRRHSCQLLVHGFLLGMKNR